VHGRAVGPLDDVPGVAFAVDDAVVRPAEQGGVAEVGGSVVEPVDQVVRVGLPPK
jgi:hypothetical protein